MTHRKVKSIFMCLFLISLYSIGWCGEIVFPGKGSTEIVKVGESFEVWFDADAGQTVNSVELQGPYNTVYPLENVAMGSWEWDPISGNTYNTLIIVDVPAGAPADRYDIVLKTSSGDELSIAGIKVIREWKTEYHVLHISDSHIDYVEKRSPHPGCWILL